MIQRLLIQIMWDIIMPILEFCWWLVMFIPNLIIEFVLKPIWFALYWLAGFMCEILFFIPKWIYFNIFLPIINFFIWLHLTILFYIKLVIRLILWPFDWLCFTIFTIIEGILDAIVAIVEVPDWQPMW